MSTMLDVTIAYLLEKCANNNYLEFDTIFDEVETHFVEKWKKEALDKGLTYDQIRINKIGELYRLLSVDSRFVRNSKGLWTTREGFE
ncbi:DNA-directed RNA polymerase subunit delta [Mycoplasma tauri]|uniref:HTH HARE-type domain-containing protein n=1 Tax=Mycoplasma tauri TaxID=547987 RepID=A0A953T9I0_9MOLU|nr:hypothetical protein [Mycoplasma tauri]MBZ4195284.1 hypothetical protein [Mycoplasma tauri]MBZ4203712.1 hypothetical protein [Mycoplasma tauri]MBZ4204334.1 hypothetical protein [Mycoplasma tauri]MBZ4212861.1 hypothetical protein [Mycoplasma tauri]MBZ4218355.1 hypothetical protein [Mycoplasma tauri]